MGVPKYKKGRGALGHSSPMLDALLFALQLASRHCALAMLSCSFSQRTTQVSIAPVGRYGIP